MKKTIRSFFAIGTLAVLAIAFAPASQAAPISTASCVVANLPPDGNTTCNGLGSAVGFTNLQIELQYALDITYDPFNPPGSAVFALDSPLVPWDLAGLLVTNATRPLNGSTGAIAISDGDYAANFQANFLVAVSATFGGSANDGNANLRYVLTGDRIPDQNVPEPTTLAMIGGALMLAGLVRRGQV